MSGSRPRSGPSRVRRKKPGSPERLGGHFCPSLTKVWGGSSSRLLAVGRVGTGGGNNFARPPARVMNLVGGAGLWATPNADACARQEAEPNAKPGGRK